MKPLILSLFLFFSASSVLASGTVTQYPFSNDYPDSFESNLTTKDSEQNELTVGETLFYIGLAEGLIATNAWLASESPNTYGVVAALLFPLGAVNSTSDHQFWGSLLIGESIAFYNISLDEDKVSKDEVFTNNMIAWHLAIVGLAAIDWMSDDEPPSLFMQPTLDGGALLTYKVRF
ncbi:hypothetical protein [Oceanospirillum sanctuarii]|uniref:hypothetical protein n=1 Tax=Oceanospirillum sanctuarii TaxID=1434821 RepID=UPI000A3B9E45|nr:hypothetical protein [Oceanospirillum sanctuarii]